MQWSWHTSTVETNNTFDLLQGKHLSLKMQPIAGMIMFDFCSEIWGNVSQGATQTASELTVQTLIDLHQLHVWRVAVCISSSDSPVAVHLDVFLQFVLFISFLCVYSQGDTVSAHTVASPCPAAFILGLLGLLKFALRSVWPRVSVSFPFPGFGVKVDDSQCLLGVQIFYWRCWYELGSRFKV